MGYFDAQSISVASLRGLSNHIIPWAWSHSSGWRRKLDVSLFWLQKAVQLFWSKIARWNMENVEFQRVDTSISRHLMPCWNKSGWHKLTVIANCSRRWGEKRTHVHKPWIRFNIVLWLTDSPSGRVVRNPIFIGLLSSVESSFCSSDRSSMGPSIAIPNLAAKLITWAIQPKSCVELSKDGIWSPSSRPIRPFTEALSAVIVCKRLTIS